MPPIAVPRSLPLARRWPRRVRWPFLSPRLRLLRRLRDRWDSYPAGTTLTGAGLSPAGSTSLCSRRTGPTSRCRAFTARMSFRRRSSHQEIHVLDDTSGGIFILRPDLQGVDTGIKIRERDEELERYSSHRYGCRENVTGGREFPNGILPLPDRSADRHPCFAQLPLRPGVVNEARPHHLRVPGKSPPYRRDDDLRVPAGFWIEVHPPQPQFRAAEGERAHRDSVADERWNLDPASKGADFSRPLIANYSHGVVLPRRDVPLCQQGQIRVGRQTV